MNIGINLLDYNPHVNGGLAIYVQSLLNYLPRISNKHRYYLFIYEENIGYLNSQKNKVISIVGITRRGPETSRAQLFKYINTYNLDLWFCPLLVLDPLDCPIPSVFCLPDLQHIHYPQFFSGEELERRNTLYKESANKADAIITLSEFSKKDIVSHFKVDPLKVHAIHLDAPPWFKDAAIGARGTKNKWGKYLFFPANFWPHKNHLNLLIAFSKIKNKHNKINLLFSGYSNDANRELTKTINKLDSSTRVKFMGYLANEQMPPIYKNAVGLVFPSLFEGFGIPLVEAMKSNCPIICSQATSIPEIASRAALYFDPLSIEDIEKKLDQFLSDKKLRSHLVEEGKKLGKRYSYLKTAKETLALFESLNSTKKKTIPDNKIWPKISIITPSYNQGRFIERTILSVLNQDYPNLEYIVMDGGSTDNTVEILKKYSEQIIWKSEKDRGQADGINKGLRIAKGKIVAYLNSDDTYEPNTLKIIANYFIKHPKEQFVYGLGKYIDVNDKYLGDYANAPTDFNDLYESCKICQPTAFWRRELIKEMGLFDTALQLAMDYDYWIRISKKYKLNYLHTYLANSRLYQETKTMNQRIPIHLEVFKIQQKYYRQVHLQWIISLVHVEQIQNNRQSILRNVYFILYLIFKSAYYFAIYNHQLPPKKAFKLYYEWLAHSIDYRLIIQRLFEKITALKKYQEIGILKQHGPSQIQIDTLPQIKQDKYLKFSIITPSYNHHKYIEKTIQSVLNQHYPNLQYIVMDGGSKDGTINILKKYSKGLSWFSKKDHGQSHALNKGFIKTDGEIMAYLNSDDMYCTNILQFVNNFFLTHPNIDVVFGHRLIIDENDKQIGRWITFKHDERVLKYLDYIPQETMFWRRKLWNKVGKSINEEYKFAMDYELILRFIKAKAKFARLPYFLGMFRYYTTSKTGSKIDSLGKEEVQRLLRKFHKKNIPWDMVVKLLDVYRIKSSLISYLYDKNIRI